MSKGKFSWQFALYSNLMSKQPFSNWRQHYSLRTTNNSIRTVGPNCRELQRRLQITIVFREQWCISQQMGTETAYPQGCPSCSTLSYTENQTRVMMTTKNIPILPMAFLTFAEAKVGSAPPFVFPRNLNTENKKKNLKHAQTLKRPPLREGPNDADANRGSSCVDFLLSI